MLQNCLLFSDTGVSQNDRLTNIPAPIFTGSATEGLYNDTVYLYRGADFLGSSFVNSDKSWTLTSQLSLADGQHEIITKYQDSAFNQAQATDALTIVIDTQIPSNDIAPALTLDSDTGIAQDKITSDSIPSFFGIGAEAGLTVSIVDNKNNALGVSIVDSNGDWRVDTTDTLIDGQYTLYSIFQDGAGNISDKSPALPILIDTTALAGNVQLVLDTGAVGDNIINTEVATIGGLGVVGDTVNIIVDGNQVGFTTINDLGRWQSEIFIPNDNVAEVEVFYSDKAGNKGELSDILTIILDNEVPEFEGEPLNIENIEEQDGIVAINGDVLSKTVPTFTGVGGDDGETAVLFANGEAIGFDIIEDGKYEFIVTESLASQTYDFTTQITDSAGNVSDLSDPFEVIILNEDLITPPSVTLPFTDSKASLTQGFNISDEIFDDYVTEVDILIDGNIVNTVNVPFGNTQWSSQIQPSNLTVGAHDVAIRYRDILGNESALSPDATFQIFVPSTPVPVVPIATDNDDDNNNNNNGAVGILNPDNDDDDILAGLLASLDTVNGLFGDEGDNNLFDVTADTGSRRTDNLLNGDIVQQSAGIADGAGDILEEVDSQTDGSTERPGSFDIEENGAATGVAEAVINEALDTVGVIDSAISRIISEGTNFEAIGTPVIDFENYSEEITLQRDDDSLQDLNAAIELPQGGLDIDDVSEEIFEEDSDFDLLEEEEILEFINASDNFAGVDFNDEELDNDDNVLQDIIATIDAQDDVLSRNSADATGDEITLENNNPDGDNIGDSIINAPSASVPAQESSLNDLLEEALSGEDDNAFFLNQGQDEIIELEDIEADIPQSNDVIPTVDNSDGDNNNILDGDINRDGVVDELDSLLSDEEEEEGTEEDGLVEELLDNDNLFDEETGEDVIENDNEIQTEEGAETSEDGAKSNEGSNDSATENNGGDNSSGGNA
jgi:hypothetical protein